MSGVRTVGAGPPTGEPSGVVPTPEGNAMAPQPQPTVSPTPLPAPAGAGRDATVATRTARTVRSYGSENTSDGEWPLLAKIAGSAIVIWFTLSTIAGALNPGYSPIREAMSALAATDADYAWVAITGFMIAAVGLACTGIVLWRRFAGNRTGRVAATLVTLAAPEMVVAGLARQDCSEQLPTCIDYGDAPLASTHFWVHQYTALFMFVSLTVALFLLARALRRDAGRARLATPTRLVAFTCLAVIVVVFMAEIGSSWHGLIQRIFAALVFGWPVVVAGSAPKPQVPGEVVGR